jgi:predicted nucleic acid-binding protein
LIVFDASTVVSAALKADSIPERVLLRAEEIDVFALSRAVDAEIAAVVNRTRFAVVIPAARRARFLEILRDGAIWFEPARRVTDCRDPKDDKYLELALAAGAEGTGDKLRQPPLPPERCGVPGSWTVGERLHS